jgi:hypothetical protein
MHRTDSTKPTAARPVALPGQPPGPPSRRRPDLTDGARAGNQGPEAAAARHRAGSDETDQARMSGEGGTEGQVGDTVGPGAGYDGEPGQVTDKGGVK